MTFKPFSTVQPCQSCRSVACPPFVAPLDLAAPSYSAFCFSNSADWKFSPWLSFSCPRTCSALPAAEQCWRVWFLNHSATFHLVFKHILNQAEGLKHFRGVQITYMQCARTRVKETFHSPMEAANKLQGFSTSGFRGFLQRRARKDGIASIFLWNIKQEATPHYLKLKILSLFFSIKDIHHCDWIFHLFPPRPAARPTLLSNRVGGKR